MHMMEFNKQPKQCANGNQKKTNGPMITSWEKEITIQKSFGGYININKKSNSITSISGMIPMAPCKK